MAWAIWGYCRDSGSPHAEVAIVTDSESDPGEQLWAEAPQGQHCRVLRDSAVAVLRLDRPPVNALSLELIAEIGEVARWLGGQGGTGPDPVRAVVVHGGPKLFAAGADIKQMAGMDYQAMAQAAISMQQSFAALAGVPMPVVAAVTGFALGGGCELALCADLRVAGQRARLGQPEVLLGLIPGLGGTQRLARLVGPGRAKDLVLTGRQVGAQEAAAMGLVDRVVADEDVLPAAMELAQGFAAGAPLALAAAKRAIDLGLGVDLASGLALETSSFAALFATDDHRIGLESFIAAGPGKAEFTGR